MTKAYIWLAARASKNKMKKENDHVPFVGAGAFKTCRILENSFDWDLHEIISHACLKGRKGFQLVEHQQFHDKLWN